MFQICTFLIYLLLLLNNKNDNHLAFLQDKISLQVNIKGRIFMLAKKFIYHTAVALALVVVSTSVQAEHTWGNYHWARSSNEITLELGDNVDSDWTDRLLEASDDWNVSTVIETNVVGGSTRPRQCRAQAGNIQVCSLAYGNNGWLGVAGISISGDHITAAYVKVNNTYYSPNYANGFYDNWQWRQFVMCQEIGHGFGLGHVNEKFDDLNTGSCMDYTDDPIGGVGEPDNTAPDSHDYQLLEDIYAHSDGGGGGGGGGGGDGCNPRSPKCNNGVSAADVLANIDANGPSGWGRLVSAHGPQEVYEINLGGGRKILTHVTWTIERANDHEH
jgi:hypothetical protein